jgi:tetratricopeptide (TPR) repeat protein
MAIPGPRRVDLTENLYTFFTRPASPLARTCLNLIQPDDVSWVPVQEEIMPGNRVRIGLVWLAAATLLLPCGKAAAQIPAQFKNLQVLPKDISRDSLINLMRSFSFATGLRCEDCHVLGENNSLEGAQFDLDDKVNKRKARFMLEMVHRINQEILPGLPERDTPNLAVECKTCHRGLSKPFLLRTELERVLDESGLDAAIARYRVLRERATLRGAYDFGEWEMNELAREVEAEGKTEAAIAFLVLNAEFYPRSASIPGTLGPLYEKAGQRDNAIAAYRRALELNPRNEAARERLRILTGGEIPS